MYGERCYGEQTLDMRLSNERLQRTFEPAPETPGICKGHAVGVVFKQSVSRIGILEDPQ